MATTENVDIKVAVVDEATKPLDKILKSFKMNTEGVTDFSKKFVAGITAAGAAAAAFAGVAVNKFSETGVAIGKMAQKTGLSTEALSGLKLAADGADISMDTVAMSVQKMQLNMAKASDGTSNLDDLFKKFGISSKEFAASSPDQQFEKLAQSIGAISNPAERTQAAMQAFGKGGAELIPILNDGNFSISEMSDQAKKLGLSFDANATKSANNFDDAMDALGATTAGLTNQLGAALAPALTTVVTGFTDWLNSVGGLPGILERINSVIQAIQPYLPIIGGVIAALVVPAFVSWAIAAASAAVATITLLAPVLAVGVGIGLLIIGVQKLIQYWPQISASFGTAWDFIKGKFDEVKNALIGGMQALADFFKATWDGITQAVNFAAALIAGIVIGIFDAMGIDIIAVLEGISVRLSEFWASITEAFTVGVNKIKELWDAVWSHVSNFAKSKWTEIKGHVTTGTNAITTALGPWIEATSKAFANMWSGISSGVIAAWEVVKATIKAGINWVLEKINTIITAANNLARKGAGALGISIPVIPTIPLLAKGGDITGAGNAIVGEAGPEMVSLPRGARVTPLSGGGVGNNITVNIINPQVWKSDDIVEQIGDPLLQVLKQHMAVA